MTRLYGRALRGERVVGCVPHGHWKTTTLIAALDITGVRCSMTLDGAVNRQDAKTPRRSLGFPLAPWRLECKPPRRQGAKNINSLSSWRLGGSNSSWRLDRLAFEAFVEQVLTPSLHPGDLVVMDNLSSHKAPRTAALIRAVDAELVYLPPYSPDFNPIEQAFSKIKQALRTLAARTVDALWREMQSVLDRVTRSDAAGYFRHCGYPLQTK